MYHTRPRNPALYQKSVIGSAFSNGYARTAAPKYTSNSSDDDCTTLPISCRLTPSPSLFLKIKSLSLKVTQNACR